jgi:hypothetical protein
MLEQDYRTSTLIRSKASSTSSNNRTMTSNVDSYLKVPPYEILSMNNNSNPMNLIEPFSTSESLSSGNESLSMNSTYKLTNSVLNSKDFQAKNGQNKEFLKSFFQNANTKPQLVQLQPHEYETISKHYNPNQQLLTNYYEYYQVDASRPNFQNFNLLPIVNGSAIPINNSTLIFLTQKQMQQPDLSPNTTSTDQSSVYADIQPIVASNSNDSSLLK